MAKIDEIDEYAELWEEAKIETEEEMAEDVDAETEDDSTDPADDDEPAGDAPDEESDGEDADDEDKPAPKHKDRAEKRISQLTAARRAAEERAAAVEAQLAEERAKYEEERKQYQSRLSEIEKQSTDNELKALQQQRRELRIKKAEHDAAADYEEVAATEDQIDDINLKISQLQNRQYQPAADPAPAQETAPAPQPAPARQDIPEAQQDWMRENTWFAKPGSLQEKKAVNKANEIFVEMTQQYGYDADDPETYEELSAELKRQGFDGIGRQPMKKALIDKSGVSSGATRPASNNARANSRLTNFDLQLMRQAGLDPQSAQDRKTWANADKSMR